MITMARGLSIPLSISTTVTSQFQHRLALRSLRCFCHCYSSVTDMSKYREAFSRRMAMAGLKPHHRIALGVSGGPDSTALCVLSAHWKTNGLNTSRDSDGFIDGILAIVVDHGLRSESNEEANIVSRRVSKMGIRCEISQCEWLDGRPKQGDVLEAARDMRYQHFQKVCIQNKICVLLIAHHSNDQAELFVLRLSRNSGVLGLAGMPFMSQIFSSYTHSPYSRNCGIVLVRPLLDFTKDDMYKICEGGEQNWVEDPTNQIPLYARNRIRISLRDYSSCSFNAEIRAVISACQQTRLYVDYNCSKLIEKVVTVTDLGYVVIDLVILSQLKIEDIVLSRFVALILQFVSQRNRPVRSSISKLVLNYIHTFPCKTSLTAAGCYLCPAPSSRGTKALVCYSVDHPLTQAKELLFGESVVEKQHQTSDEIEKIIESSKLYSHHMVPDSSKHFLNMNSESVLTEAVRLNILSDSTCEKILSLQSEEVQQFRSNKKVAPESEPKGRVKPISMYSEPIRSGIVCSFMNRFFVKWKVNEKVSSTKDICDCTCVVSNETLLEVRHMAESDWQYLANLLKSSDSEKFQRQELFKTSRVDRATKEKDLCLDHAIYSAGKALRTLKSIPVAARKGLPVLVDGQGLLLSIPNIGFKHCPRLDVIAIFNPRVPLGGGYSLFI